MRVAIISFGSQGDTRPLIALSQSLVRAGHKAILLADPEFGDLAGEAGVDFVPLAGGSVRDLFTSREIAKPHQRGFDVWGVMQVLMQHMGRYTETWGRQLRKAASDADVVVASGLTFFIGLAVAESLGLPTVAASLQPVVPTRDFPPAIIRAPGMPRIVYPALHRLVSVAVWFLTARSVQRLRRSTLGLPKWPWYGPARQMLRERTPLLVAVSPTVVPRPRDWPDFIHLTGFWYLDAADAYQPPARLLRFLEADEPPVYVGFGSMAGFDPLATAELLVEALGGRRAIIAAGWGGLTSAALPDNVLCIEAAPHDWLLPRMSLAVHHGGAGTTAAVARAGIPQVVIPHITDQPFWAACVRSLGVGPAPIERRTLTAENLAVAIHEAESPAMRRAAAALGKRVRAEDGVGEAVRLIEKVARSNRVPQGASTIALPVPAENVGSEIFAPDAVAAFRQAGDRPIGVGTAG
jgi:UDP:flavonoid glycosyltransferase YjiC (YdhE family)